jgi:thiamine transport system permease protein
VSTPWIGTRSRRGGAGPAVPWGVRPAPFAHALGLAAAAALTLGVVAPLAALALRTWDASAGRAFVDPAIWGIVGRSALQAAASTALALLLGAPAAWALSRPELPLRRLWRALFVIPFVLPSLVAATAVLAWVGPRGLLGLDLRDTWWVVVLAHAFYNVGIVARVVGGHLEGAAPRLLEAAATLGAPPWRRAWRVTLPTAAPAVVASAALVFLFCFTSFGVILVLAPAPTFATLEVEIYRRVARSFDLGGASALALLQLTLVLLLALPYLRAQARLARGVDRAARPATTGPRWPALAAVAPAGALVTLPLVALFALAASPPGGATLAGAVRSLATPSRIVGLTDAPTALANSLRFGVVATLLALAIGAALALAVERGGWRWLDAFGLLPWAVSAVTLGLGLLLLAPGLAASAWGVPLAHALLATPLVARVGVAALAGVPRAWREAAATLGATPWRTVRRLDLPVTRAAWASAAAFAFAASLGEFGAALLLRRPETTTLPVAIAERLGRPGAGSYAEALALAALLALLVGVSVALIDLAGGRRRADPF